MVSATNGLDVGMSSVALPVYATDVLHSSVAFGLITAALGAGAVVGAVIFSWRRIALAAVAGLRGRTATLCPLVFPSWRQLDRHPSRSMREPHPDLANLGRRGAAGIREVSFSPPDAHTHAHDISPEPACNYYLVDEPAWTRSENGIQAAEPLTRRSC